jgi:hypothetical protein
MKKLDTYIEKLVKQIEDIYPIIDLMLDNSSIFYHDPNANSRGVFFLGADVYHWRKKDEKNQLKAREKFLNFIENFELLSQKANPDTQREIKDADKQILDLINQNHAPSSIDNGKKIFRDLTKAHKDFLSLFIEKEIQTYIIPDTNSIVQFPDPNSYKKISQTDKFIFIIPPTIIRELESHKMFHKNEAFRDKAKSVITRLKGYRNQGDVLDGVTVNKSITVKMVATEPNFEKTLKWLDPNNNDDRIIASILEIQIDNPSDIVILVTNDINLQNKAQLANLTTCDSDDLTDH